MDDTLTSAQIDELSRKIQTTIYEKHQVILHTVGIYSVNTDPKATELRNSIYSTIKKHPEILEIHGFYLNSDTKHINLDIIISFDAEDRHALHKQIISELNEAYPDYQFDMTLDLDISD